MLETYAIMATTSYLVIVPVSHCVHVCIMLLMLVTSPQGGYKEPCSICAAVEWGISDEGRFYCKSCHNVIEVSQAWFYSRVVNDG